MRLEYQGGRKYVTTMNASDRQAAAELYELSQLLSSMEQIKKKIKETNIHIEFIKRNRKQSNIE
ncbi:hypothetical protein EZS27_039770 [termite gut metagenome]|uniref:Uncharacterized protein n=1 Tax=termite gut metagenome TaxID=433724 RepID=A0A5J4PGC9_9ZZZZ